MKVAGNSMAAKRSSPTAKKTYARPRSYSAGNCTDADIARVLWWSNYSAKCIALIQARGMPIDVPLWNLVQENKTAVIAELLRQLDPSSGSNDPIYNAAGEWDYRRFERWLISTGVAAWPRLDSGRLDVDGDAFRLMYHVPGIEGLHALRDSLRVIQTAKLPIGRDGRNRPSLFPFGTATGRNAHCRSLYNSHAGMRGFMLFPPDKYGVYLDWRTQEVGVAGALSGDQALIDSYNSGDVYHVLALDKRPHERHQSETLEGRQPDATPAHEGAATRRQLRHGRGVIGKRSQSASTDCEQSNRATPPKI